MITMLSSIKRLAFAHCDALHTLLQFCSCGETSRGSRIKFSSLSLTPYAPRTCRAGCATVAPSLAAHFAAYCVLSRLKPRTSGEYAKFKVAASQGVEYLVVLFDHVRCRRSAHEVLIHSLSNFCVRVDCRKKVFILIEERSS